MAAVYETERLVVRPWTTGEDDVARLFAIRSRWEVSRWLGAEPKVMAHPDEAVAMIERWRGLADRDGRFGVWAAEVRDTGVVAGTVLLLPIPRSGEQAGRLPEDGGDVEVGWHLHPEEWGRGYATEAARGALAKGFAEGLDEVVAVVYPGNDPSMAVCRRLGMTPEGRTDRWYGVELESFRTRRPA